MGYKFHFYIYTHTLHISGWITSYRRCDRQGLVFHIRIRINEKLATTSAKVPLYYWPAVFGASVRMNLLDWCAGAPHGDYCEQLPRQTEQKVWSLWINPPKPLFTASVSVQHRVTVLSAQNGKSANTWSQYFLIRNNPSMWLSLGS